MAFQQGLSGLNTSSRALDVASNNIANASTVGFKSSGAHFGDVYAASLAGAGASQVGIGANLAAVQQQYTQGNITTTNNTLDVSINGSGFFRMDQNGAVTYTRNGQFHLDKNGYIVNDQSMKLTGYMAQNGVITASTPVALQVSASDLAPVATGASTSSAFQGVKVNMNVDSRTDYSNYTTVAPAGGHSTFSTSDPLSYSYSTATTIYDSLGNDHTLTMYFRKDPAGATRTWEVYAAVDGTQVGAAGAGATSTLTGGNLVFGSNGALSAATAKKTISIDLAAIAPSAKNNAAAPLSFTIDFTGTTEFGSPSGTNRIEQDGYAAGHLVGLSIGSDGVVQGRYSNGQTFNQGQIVLANFTNPNGLVSLGNNQWSESSVSGPPLVGAPNTSNLGVLQSSSVEDSNVDLTAELVNLITYQRNYQANAQSIKTQDQIMNTLVNMR